ncbi:MAG: J domain-containing protein, partial [Bacteroidia bacterium]|nr:J domain-containing protein [Bacteroidia bacterium]MDW8134926.1 J domain-containing protein [Bacteroidia bacterium]
MNPRKDYYAILGVSRDADIEAIKQSYRRLALQYHPDRNPGNKEAEERFKEISEAYEVLSDPQKRREYDLFGVVGSRGSSDPFSQMVEEVFESFFGRNTRYRPSAPPGEDIKITLELTLEEIAQGISQEIKYERKEICNKCNGSGSETGALHPCSRCGGNGQVAYRVGGGFFQQIIYQTCPECGGKGWKVVSSCPTCKGTGLLNRLHVRQVEIPPGAVGGMMFSIRGGGHCGAWGGTPGDLIIEIVEKPHPL